MASNSIISLLLQLLLLILLPLSSAISDETINNAVETLFDSGFNHMSLTLPLISQTLLSSLPYATLFTPSSSSDAFFSFSLLQYHFCPHFYSSSELHSLPHASQLPTLLPNHPLTVTSPFFHSDNITSINGVNVDTSPVFNDGFLVIFHIHRFFDPEFAIDAPLCSTFTPGLGSYRPASTALRSRGYSIMAALLDLQLSQFDTNNNISKKMTVFAPTDAAMEGHLGNFSEWGSVFLRHVVVGCKLTWGDMIELSDGSGLGTFLEGFEIKVTNNTLTVNKRFDVILNGNVTLESPEFFRNRWLIVHGISGVLVNSPAVDAQF